MMWKASKSMYKLAIRMLSLPQIKSGRIGDAVPRGSAEPRSARLPGQLVGAERPWQETDAYGRYCSSRHNSRAYAEDAAPQARRCVKAFPPHRSNQALRAA